MIHFSLTAQPQESLRRRFGNALLWYTNLVNSTDHHVREYVSRYRLASGLPNGRVGSGHGQDILEEVERNNQADGESILPQYARLC